MHPMLRHHHQVAEDLTAIVGDGQLTRIDMMASHSEMLLDFAGHIQNGLTVIQISPRMCKK
jgi:hypothetical protein